MPTPLNAQPRKTRKKITTLFCRGIPCSDSKGRQGYYEISRATFIASPWVYRVDISIKSYLDLVILLSNLLSFLTMMVVDKKQQYCSKRVRVRNNKSKVVKWDY